MDAQQHPQQAHALQYADVAWPTAAYNEHVYQHASYHDADGRTNTNTASASWSGQQHQQPIQQHEYSAPSYSYSQDLWNYAPNYYNGQPHQVYNAQYPAHAPVHDTTQPYHEPAGPYASTPVPIPAPATYQAHDYYVLHENAGVVQASPRYEYPTHPASSLRNSHYGSSSSADVNPTYSASASAPTVEPQHHQHQHQQHEQYQHQQPQPVYEQHVDPRTVAPANPYPNQAPLAPEPSMSTSPADERARQWHQEDLAYMGYEAQSQPQLQYHPQSTPLSQFQPQEHCQPEQQWHTYPAQAYDQPQSQLEYQAPPHVQVQPSASAPVSAPAPSGYGAESSHPYNVVAPVVPPLQHMQPMQPMPTDHIDHIDRVTKQVPQQQHHQEHHQEQQHPWSSHAEWTRRRNLLRMAQEEEKVQEVAQGVASAAGTTIPTVASSSMDSIPTPTATVSQPQHRHQRNSSKGFAVPMPISTATPTPAKMRHNTPVVSASSGSFKRPVTRESRSGPRRLAPATVSAPATTPIIAVPPQAQVQAPTRPSTPVPDMRSFVSPTDSTFSISSMSSYDSRGPPSSMDSFSSSFTGTRSTTSSFSSFSTFSSPYPSYPPNSLMYASDGSNFSSGVRSCNPFSAEVYVPEREINNHSEAGIPAQMKMQRRMEEVEEKEAMATHSPTPIPTLRAPTPSDDDAVERGFSAENVEDPSSDIPVVDGGIPVPMYDLPPSPDASSSPSPTNPTTDTTATTTTANPRRRRPNKSKHRLLACLHCRSKKIACGAPADGSATGKCTQCVRRGMECVYPVENLRGRHKVVQKEKRLAKEAMENGEMGVEEGDETDEE